MRVLVDMDNTIAHWGYHMDALLDGLTGTEHMPRHDTMTQYNLHDGLTLSELSILRKAMNKPGFYRDIPVIDGAVDALHDMALHGHEVFIVTTPWQSNPTCASDKMAWVDQHLGADWVRRTIITHDKTLVVGDVLIDDKPTIHGVNPDPHWHHVLFDQPYNREINKPRITNWGPWKEVVG